MGYGPQKLDTLGCLSCQRRLAKSHISPIIISLHNQWGVLREYTGNTLIQHSLHKYLITQFWVGEAERLLTSQEVRGLLSGTKIQCRLVVFTRGLAESSERNLPHTLYYKLNFNIILPTTPKFKKWTFSSDFSDWNFLHISYLRHTFHMLRPSKPPIFGLPNHIQRRLQIMEVFITLFSPLFFISSSLGANTFLFYSEATFFGQC